MRNLAAFLILTLIATPLFPAAEPNTPAKVWKKGLCRACHGDNGSGDTPAGKNLGAKDLRSEAVQARSDEEIRKTIREGQNKMPSFEETFSEEELDAVVQYVRQLAKKK